MNSKFRIDGTIGCSSGDITHLIPAIRTSEYQRKFYFIIKSPTQEGKFLSKTPDVHVEYLDPNILILTGYTISRPVGDLVYAVGIPEGLVVPPDSICSLNVYLSGDFTIVQLDEDTLYRYQKPDVSIIAENVAVGVDSAKGEVVAGEKGGKWEIWTAEAVEDTELPALNWKAFHYAIRPVMVSLLHSVPSTPLESPDDLVPFIRQGDVMVAPIRDFRGGDGNPASITYPGHTGFVYIPKPSHSSVKWLKEGDRVKVGLFHKKGDCPNIIQYNKMKKDADGICRTSFLHSKDDWDLEVFDIPVKAIFDWEAKHSDGFDTQLQRIWS